MPTIDSAVAQASDMMDKGTIRPASPAGPGRMSAAAERDVKDVMSSFPMPSLQAFSDPVRQGNRNNMVPQYRSVPPTPVPATNITINGQVFERAAGGGLIVVSGGGSSVVTNTPGTPGSPGTPTGPIPATPSTAGDLTAATPVAVSSVRQVIGGPAIISVATMGPSGASHERGVVPDPGAVAGTNKFLREDASWQVPPVFLGSGVGHAVGYVPDPGAVAGTTKYLREDGTWSSSGIGLEPVTNGDSAFPELVFAGGDVVMA